jgi:poly(A) polymerase
MSVSSENSRSSKQNQRHHKNKIRRCGERKGHKPHLLYPRIKSFHKESEQSNHLEEHLREINLYDSPEGLEKRRQACLAVEDLLQEWALSLQRPFAAALLGQKRRHRVALVSFGSYRLGVHAPGADLDLLALCPPHVTRGDFFTSLVKLLQESDQITQVHPIPAAYTPVIKFVYDGVIDIDLLFARLAKDEKLQNHKLGTEFQIDDSDLLELDEAAVRSLNGARVSQILLEAVPNIETFRTTLRAVKEWARANGLYSNVLGFLGGINFALLVACICRRHPPSTKPATLLKAFFVTFAQWNWPTPVTLQHVEYQPPPGVHAFSVWNSKTNPRDRLHLMPILTPTYPSMNSAYNVGLPQLRRLVQEFRRGLEIIQAIEDGAATWSDLFQGQTFFQKHHYFLQITIVASHLDDFCEWFRFVESRMRLLIVSLDSPGVSQAAPYCQFFYRSPTEANLFVAIRFAQDRLDLGPLVSDFLLKINAWEGRQAGMDILMQVVTRHDLPDFLFEKRNKVGEKKSEEAADKAKESNNQPDMNHTTEKYNEANDKQETHVPEGQYDRNEEEETRTPVPDTIHETPLPPETATSSATSSSAKQVASTLDQQQPQMSWAMKVARGAPSPAKRART